MPFFKKISKPYLGAQRKKSGTLRNRTMRMKNSPTPYCDGQLAVINRRNQYDIRIYLCYLGISFQNFVEAFKGLEIVLPVENTIGAPVDSFGDHMYIVIIGVAI